MNFNFLIRFMNYRPEMLHTYNLIVSFWAPVGLFLKKKKKRTKPGLIIQSVSRKELQIPW